MPMPVGTHVPTNTIYSPPSPRLCRIPLSLTSFMYIDTPRHHWQRWGEHYRRCKQHPSGMPTLIAKHSCVWPGISRPRPPTGQHVYQPGCCWNAPVPVTQAQRWTSLGNHCALMVRQMQGMGLQSGGGQGGGG